MNPAPTPQRHRIRLALVALAVSLPMALGCSGLLQNLGAKWVTRQIAAEFNLDEAQTEATRASVDRLIAAAPAALGSKVDMLVATVDAAIAKGFSEKKLIGMERQIDKIGTITGKLMRITRYETCEYIEGRKIIDIDRASGVTS